MGTPDRPLGARHAGIVAVAAAAFAAGVLWANESTLPVVSAPGAEITIVPADVTPEMVRSLDQHTTALAARLRALEVARSESRPPLRRTGRRPAAPTPRLAPAPADHSSAPLPPPTHVTPAAAEDPAPRWMTELQLIGVATTRTPDGPVYTAVVKRGGAVRLVGVGEVVAGSLTVARIADDAVVLTDAVTTATHTLTFR